MGRPRKKVRKQSNFLPEEVVQLILDELIAGKKPKELAHKYNVVEQTIGFYKRERLEVILRRKVHQGSFDFSSRRVS